MFRKVIKSHVARRRVSWVIAGVLILPFILFFHATGQAPPPGPGGLAGKLFGKPIPWEAFQTQRLWLKRRFESQLGELPERFQLQLIQLTWDRLMMLEEAKRQRLRIDDRALAAFLHQIPAFQDAGRFSPRRYYEFLRLSGTSPEAFEELLKTDLLIQKLQDRLEAPIPVTDEELRAAFTESAEQLRVAAIRLDASPSLAQVRDAILESELRASYEAHLNAYRIPAQLTLEYAGASAEELARKVEITEQHLETFYRQHPDRYAADSGEPAAFDTVRERIRRDLTDERVRSQLAALAVDLEDDLKANRPFEEIVTARALAAQSVGPVPAAGLQVPEGLDPTILQAARRMRRGETSDVIETGRGIYLVRVTDRIPERIQPFDEVRDRVKEGLMQERAKALAKEAAERLKTRLHDAIAGGLRFEEATLKEGVSLLHPAPFTRTQPVEGIGEAPAFNTAAFQTSLGQLSEAIEVPGGWALVRPEERLPPDPARLAEVETSLRQDLAERKRAQRYSAWLLTLRGRAKVESYIEEEPLEPSS